LIWGRRAWTPERGLFLLAVLVFGWLFFHTAWISDDARITFRSVEQFAAGHGPRWNPHERVQAFTHPLWFLALATLRAVSADSAGNAFALSALLGLVALGVSRRLFGDPYRWLLAWGLLFSSKAFVDFLSSGLENPLVFALLTVLLVLLGYRPDGTPGVVLFAPQRLAAADGARRSEEANETSPRTVAGILPVTAITALLLLCRHDLALLVGPPYLAFLLRPLRAEPRRTIGAAAIGALPFILWTLFAVVYYGFPFPNTAYAKLSTGIPASELWRQGIAYVVNLARWDPLTLVLLGAGMALALFQRSRRVWLGFGMAAYLAYVVHIGGDFMAGRFFTPVLLVAAFEVADRFPLRHGGVLVALLFLYALVLPGSPWTSGASYRAAYDYRTPGEAGITDERGYYFKESSLRAHLAGLDRTPPPLTQPVTVAGTVGATGLQAGLDRILVDENALCDPLLARLPAERPWRVGHFQRTLPVGYLQSLEDGRNRVANRYVRSLYADLRRITQGPLWTAKRWQAIVRLNLHPPQLPCAAPPCRELVLHVLKASDYTPRFWRMTGSLSSVQRDQERVRVEGRLPYGDLIAGQRLLVAVPYAPLSADIVPSQEPAAPRRKGGAAPQGTFAIELRFASPNEATIAARDLCVATDSADHPGGLLATRRPICRRLLGAGVAPVRPRIQPAPKVAPQPQAP
jgi:arabinofuranosyltransferase